MDVPPPPPTSSEDHPSEDSGAPIAPPPPAPTAQPAAEPSGGRSKRRRALVIAVVGVVLVALVGGAIALSGGADETDIASASPSSSPTPAVPGPPLDLRAEKATAFEVGLMWSPGEGSPATSYEVTRDGELIYVVTLGGTDYTDEHVVPGTTYDYEVVAVDADENRSDAALLTVTTKDAAPGLAPLAGLYDIRLDETSHYGFSSFNAQKYTTGWRLEPKCDQGACNTDLRDVNVKTFKTILKHGKKTYTARLSVRGFGRCGSVPGTSTVTITLRPVDAAFKRGRWRVTRLEGTMIVRSAPQLGCVGTGIDYEFTGRFVR